MAKKNNGLARIPNTPTQKWLRSMRACRNGRAEVAGQTLSQWFNSTCRPDWMRWLLIRLTETDGNFSLPDSLRSTRKLRQWAKDNNVRVPLGI